MKVKTSIRFYNNYPIRSVYDEENSAWLYSAVDLIGSLTNSKSPKKYWYVLKKRNPSLFSYCQQLKLKSRDNKAYRTDVINDTGINELLILLSRNNDENINNWLKGLNNPLDEKSKQKAYELYDSGLLDDIDVGTTKGLQQIHAYIFGGLYDFAGKIRTKTIMKDNFVFCDSRYLKQTLKEIDLMPQNTLEEIVNKYTEMNIAHPFMEGNGRSTRIWLDQILKANLNKCVDWSKIEKKEYLKIMKNSPINNKPLIKLIKSSLTTKINDRELFMKGIDYSYYYEEME